MKNEAKSAVPSPALQIVPANKFFNEKGPLRVVGKSEAESHTVAPPVSDLAQEERTWDEAWFASYE